jgi:hypothetical protein
VFISSEELAPSTQYYERSYYRSYLMQYLLRHDRHTKRTTLLEPLINTGFALNFNYPALTDAADRVAFSLQIDAANLAAPNQAQIYLMPIAQIE